MEKPIDDCFMIGFTGGGGDRSVLVAIRQEETGLNVIYEALDEEAEELYKRLTDSPLKRKVEEMLAEHKK